MQSLVQSFESNAFMYFHSNELLSLFVRCNSLLVCFSSLRRRRSKAVTFHCFAAISSLCSQHSQRRRYIYLRIAAGGRNRCKVLAIIGRLGRKRHAYDRAIDTRKQTSSRFPISIDFDCRGIAPIAPFCSSPIKAANKRSNETDTRVNISAE